MFQLPKKGIAYSATKHNCDANTIVDWIEAGCLFSQKVISKTDIVDVLLEENVYSNQDFARELTNDIWPQFIVRQNALDAFPFEVVGNIIRSKTHWKECPTYALFLVASLRRVFPKWSIDTFGRNYIKQGELFEYVTAECLNYSGWDTFVTGWSGTKCSGLNDTIEEIADWIGEPSALAGVARWSNASAKDAQLDIICHKPFADNMGGRPIMLVQCASGGNWKGKVREPDLEKWCKFIDFSNRPQRGISIPFCIDREDLEGAALHNWMVLDRYRLLELLDDLVSTPVDDDIIEWIEKHESAILALIMES